MTDINATWTRLGRVKSRWGLGLACILAGALLTGAPVRAESSDDALYDHFRLGWYHNLTGINRLPEIAETKAPLVMPYHDEELAPFLDRSQELGVAVLPEIPRNLINDKDYDGIAAYVEAHDAHPAVLGWYSADEPGLKKKADWSPPVMKAVYEAIRSKSEKSVYLCFSYVEMDRGDVLKYRESFDVMLVNHYPYVLNQLGQAKAAKDLEYWKNLIVKTAATAREVDRPWLNILQAIGPRKNKKEEGWRLPTFEEARFQLYWSVLHDAEGALYFCYYWARNVQPSPGEAYEESGRTWLTSVLTPLAEEFKPAEAALLPRHAVENGVTVSNDAVRARVYRDPKDESLVLVAVNPTTAAQQAQLTITVSGDWHSVSAIAGGQSLQGENPLKLELAPHGVFVCRLSR